MEHYSILKAAAVGFVNYTCEAFGYRQNINTSYVHYPNNDAVQEATKTRIDISFAMISKMNLILFMSFSEEKTIVSEILYSELRYQKFNNRKISAI